MFKNLSLRIKLSLAFLLIAVLVGSVGYYQIKSLSDTTRLFNDFVHADIERRQTLDEIKITVSDIERKVLHYAQAVTDGEASSPTATKAELVNLDARLTELFKQYSDNLAGKAREHIKARTIAATANDAHTMAQLSSGFLDATQKKSSNTQKLHHELEAITLGVNAKVNDLKATENKLIKEEQAELDGAMQDLKQIMVLLVGAVIIISTLLGLIVADTITRALSRLREEAVHIANGDFSRRVAVHSSDEVGQLAQAFNSMTVRLRDSYQRLTIETERDRILLESLGEGVIAIDEKTNILLINEPAMELLDLDDRDKLITVPVNQTLRLLDEHDRALTGAATPVVAALESAEPVRNIYNYVRKDGSKIKLDVSANPVVVNNKIAGAIMNLRDVTKEKEIDRMKTEFISLASHQLRTPLSAIKWFSEMLVSGDAGKLKADQLEFAHNISDSTERMIALVNALLNISRIESGRIMIDPKPTDLKELVSGIVNDLKGKTSEKQQSLIISVHGELPKINLDPRLIGQVYLNLLTNAVKYTQKGGEISVFISRKSDDIISQVTDNGYGIPKAQQERIFQKFFRAANAVKVETDGTGLGLYLIKSIVESSGGKIWFESEEGKGTTFWFSMPVSGMKPKEGEVTLDV